MFGITLKRNNTPSFTTVKTNANAYYFEGNVLCVDFSMLVDCSVDDIAKDICYLVARSYIEQAEEYIREKSQQAIYLCYNQNKTARINTSVIRLDKQQKAVTDGG